MTDLQAGWYPDPAGDATKLRYWNGTQWTNDLADSGAAMAQQVQQAQPMPAPQPAPMPAQAMPAPGMATQQPQPQYPQQAPQYAPQPAPYGAPAPKPTKGKLLGIIAMVLAVLGLIVAFVPILAFKTSIGWLSLVLIVLGIILGIVSMIMAKGGKGPKAFTLGGTAASGAALLITFVWLIVVGISPENYLADYQNPNQNNNNNNNVAVTDPFNSNTNTNTNTNTDTNTNTNTDNNTVTIPAQQLTGSVIGQVGTTYATRWFDFTINSMHTSNSYESYTAGNGNTLVICNITITNTYSSAQPFGTFDWLLDDDALPNYIFPMDPPSGANSMMMPTNYTLNPGDTVTYDVVIEYPANLANPVFMYIEVDSNGQVGTAFMIPVK